MIDFWIFPLSTIWGAYQNSRFLAFHQAGDERIELPPKVLETPIIPLDQSPMFCFCTPLLGTHYLYHIPYVSVNRIFHFFQFFCIFSNFIYKTLLFDSFFPFFVSFLFPTSVTIIIT